MLFSYEKIEFEYYFQVKHRQFCIHQRCKWPWISSKYVSRKSEKELRAVVEKGADMNDVID